jgi:hypothetical protein
LKDIPDSFKPPKIKKSSQESSPEPGITKRPAASSSSNSSSSAAVAAVVRAAAVSQLKSSSEPPVKKPSSTLNKSVFSRLGEQEGEEEEEYVEKKKPDMKELKKVQVEVTLKRPEAGIKGKKEVKKEKGSSSDEEYGPKQPVVKKEKMEKPSIFDRLEKVPVWLFLYGLIS